MSLTNLDSSGKHKGLKKTTSRQRQTTGQFTAFSGSIS